MKPTPAKPLYFRHIPKTAGSSVRTWLFHALDPDSLCQIGMIDQLFWKDVAYQKFSVFTAHCQGYLDTILGKETTQCTVLREPTARVFSQYKQIKRAEYHPHHTRVARQDFQTFVDDARNEIYTRNFQARHLCPPIVDAIALTEQLSEEDLRAFRLSLLLNEASLAWSDDEMATHAEQTLHRMTAVGTACDIRSFLSELARHLDVDEPDPSMVPRVNVGPDTSVIPDLTQATRNRLRSLTEVDRMLYERCRRRDAFRS